MLATNPRATSRSLYFYGPKSFSALQLMGFGVVALPLAFALIYGAYHVERLAAQSQATVNKAVHATQDTRMLLEQLTAMERTVRQYQVLNDDSLFQAYAEKHQTFQQTINTLLNTIHDPVITTQLRTLSIQEAQQYEVLRQEDPHSSEAQSAIARFIPLTEMTQHLLTEGGKVIDSEVAAMNDDTEKTLKTLLWLAFSLAPVAQLFAGAFTVLQNRPIKQIERAIRRLGEGEFTSPIAITGPRDMEYLGQQLEWLRRRLTDLERQKTKFIRHVSHELKTPLTALREGAELLADEVVGGLRGEQKEIVHILRQNSIRLQKLIEDLLHFNVAISSPAFALVEAQRLDEVITRVADDHKLTLVSKGIRLDTDLQPICVEGEAEKLRVIVDNLLSNAVKYSPVGSAVRLTLKEKNDRVVLDIYDSGPGVNPGESEKIFDAFYQGKTPADSYVKGTGLGLSMTKKKKQAQHNTKETQCDAPGAHFRVTFPHKQIHQHHAACLQNDYRLLRPHAHPRLRQYGATPRHANGPCRADGPARASRANRRPARHRDCGRLVARLLPHHGRSAAERTHQGIQIGGERNFRRQIPAKPTASHHLVEPARHRLPQSGAGGQIAGRRHLRDRAPTIAARRCDHLAQQSTRRTRGHQKDSDAVGAGQRDAKQHPGVAKSAQRPEGNRAQSLRTQQA